MRKIYIVSILMFALLVTGCSDRGQVMDGDGMIQKIEYTQITQDKAKQMMKQDDGHIIVDVRRQDEYAEGHIPGAILIPNEIIGEEPPKELPDFDQIILVYCRSGRRSKEASQKLADMGYSNVYEFGGIIDWIGDIERGEPERISSEGEKYDMTPMPIVGVRVGDNCFTVNLEDNSSAKEFLEKINQGDLSVDMHDYGGFEKVGDLPWELPANDERITTKPGDIILYQGNKITIYYDENTWDFTKLGELRGGTPEDIEEWKRVFGGTDNITAEFFVEWTE
jgi:rhodanese-related sulfurtransferase